MKKKLSCTKIIVHGGRWDFAQNCKCSNIFRKTKFLGKCLFHFEIFGATNFLIALRICIVNAIISFKNISKLIQYQFLSTVKGYQCEYFGYVYTIMFFFLLKFDLIFLSDPQSKNKEIKLEKKTQGYFFQKV